MGLFRNEVISRSPESLRTLFLRERLQPTANQLETNNRSEEEKSCTEELSVREHQHLAAMVEEYNSTLMTGGDSLTEDLNIYYEVRGIASIPACIACVEKFEE